MSVVLTARCKIIPSIKHIKCKILQVAKLCKIRQVAKRDGRPELVSEQNRAAMTTLPSGVTLRSPSVELDELNELDEMDDLDELDELDELCELGELDELCELDELGELD